MRRVLQAAVSRHAHDGRELAPRALGGELPRERVVGEVDVEDLGQPLAQPGIGDGHDRLDPAFEVAGHEIGGADEVLGGLGIGAEAVDARVLEEPPDDRTHPDRLRQAGHPGPEAADPADEQVDLGAGGRRRVERVDHRRVDEAVHLQGDPPGRPLLGFARDALAERTAEMRGRDEQLAVVALAAVAGEVVEEVGEVGAEVGIGGEQTRCLRRGARSAGCSCRCRRGSSGGCRRPPGARRAGPWRASSARRGRRRRARRLLRGRGPVRCWPARRTAP